MLYKGDYTKGEIELITDEALVEKLVPEKMKPVGVVYADEYIRIQKDPVLFPNGKAGTYIRLISQKISLNGNTGSAVIGVANGKVLLINIFRHALRRRSLEIPRGFSEGGSDIETAMREVKEETGYTPYKIDFIGSVNPDSGLTSSQVAIYFATLDTSDRTELDDTEAVGDQRFYSMDEIKTLICDGDITDSYTLSALTMAMIKGFLPI
jgi:ADP-ribose pyrophosphatase